jgi:RNA polymerase sigma factor (sigma-70 family)
MSHIPWWTSIDAAQLLELRRRLLEGLRSQFSALGAEDLEDIVQQAFVQVFRRPESVTVENDGLFRYLATASRNLALDRKKTGTLRQERIKRVGGTPLESESETTVPPVEPPITPSESEEIWQILRALPELDRLILWSYVVQGKSTRQVARELGLNWHTVARSVDRSIRRIRQILAS